MLKLNVYCSLIPCSTPVKVGVNHGSWVIQYGKAKSLPRRIIVKALKDGMDGGMSRLPGQNWEPGLEIEVPFEQRPDHGRFIVGENASRTEQTNYQFEDLVRRQVNEYSSLKDGPLYSWGELSPQSLLLRLGGLWLVTFTVLGVPIAAASFNPSREPLRFALAAGTGTLFLVSLIVLRIYLGWSYVGDRLLSAVIPYEESGWYDGQMWVKPPEILARDRLLGSYKVKPVIKLLKQTLVGTGALLVTAVLLFTFATPVEDFLQNSFNTNENPSDLSASKISKKFNMRTEELLRLPSEVRADDDLAAAAAEAADGRPVYCRDRYHRALAGGQYCKWEDLMK
ncbi:hypothetical protein RJ640_030543 [Escallonia rubra]|uniref:Uncharacterized protein n=1 Tax=Escallonia rubra TaxID=112253 RepID=A0AA88QEC4_9ASTE|nr:hypothetical protein RJ640_030543 [Escallonia rubra]